MTFVVFSKSQTVPVLLLVLAGFFTFYTYNITGLPDLGGEVQLTADMMLYMTYAQNMALGNGYVDFNGEPTLGRGPGFPLMIQWACWLLGSSTRSAFWVVRVFCIANPVLVYWLGRKMFNTSVGFAAALLVLTSYSVNFWSYRHLDAVWPFFTLASVFLLYKAFELERLSYAVASGLLSAASFLVKESAALFFPLPIILVVVVSEFRTRKNLLHALLCLGVVFMTLGPWLYWTREAGIIGLTRATSILGLGLGLPQLSWLYFSGLIGYYSGYGGPVGYSLSSQFSIAPLFVIAWLFTLIAFFRRGPGCKVCAVCLALLTPLAAYVAKDQLRPGQLVVLFLLNYLVLSFFLYSVAEWLSTRLLRDRSWNKRRAAGYAFTLMVVPVILFQFFVHHERDKGGGAFLERSYFVHHFRELKSDSGRRRLPSPPRQVKEYAFGLGGIVTWFEKHAARDAVILVGDGGPLDYGRKLFLESRGELRLRHFPVVLVRYTNWGIRRPSIRWENETYSFRRFEFPPPEDLLFLRNQGSGKGWILFESHLLKKIDELDVEYVVVGPRLHFLAGYFQESDSFASVASFGDGREQIFQVAEEALSAPHEVFVGNQNQAHSWIALLTRRLGLGENTAEALRSGQLPPGFHRAVPFGRR